MGVPTLEHRGADLDRWLDAYAGGAPVGKTEIFSAISDALAPLLGNYRYLRTKASFLREDSTADQYVTLERSKGTVSLRFGVTHHLVEGRRQLLFGPRSVGLRHVPLTISMYSANMGPHSRGWHLPYRVQWPVFGQDGLALAVPEICTFVEETVTPYLEQHRSAANVRDTYLHRPRHADVTLLSEQLVFTIDHLLGETDRLAADREILLAQRGSPEDRRRVDDAYACVSAARQPSSLQS